MLKIGKSAPFDEDIEKATNENNLTEDWSLIMHICDNAINYQDGAKFCIKAILKRLHHGVPRVVLQTLTLLDACVKNCDRRFLLQVASSEFISEAKKLLGKMHPSGADKLKELIQKWSLEEFKDDPELCIIPSLYYELKSKGVEFPVAEKKKASAGPICTNPDAVTSQEEENDIMKAIEMSLKDTGKYKVSAEYPNTSLTSEVSSKPQTESFKVRAMYDFDAAEDNELTIKIGEIVMVVDNSNSSWWKGSNHRGEGLFPANFVTQDLDYKPEEITVQTVSTVETVQDTSFVGEVKINEQKIETLINWLNDTDPACESPDSEDMLRLEDEVHKMGPLVEEQLQLVDKRLATLNLVNEKIMAGFDLFHSLSDNWTPMPHNIKYGAAPLSQPQVPIAVMPSTRFPIMPGLPTQQMMFVAPPSSVQQYMPTGEQAASDPGLSAVPVTQLPMTSQPNLQDTSAASSSSQTLQTVSSSEQASSAVTDSAKGSSQIPATVNSYSQNPVGGFYVPSPVPFPFPYPQHAQNLPPQAFVQPQNSAASVMNIPYPVPPAGPYFPFPYYYMNSPAPTQISASSTNVQSSSQESLKMPSPPSTTEQNMSAVLQPLYSNDLHSMTYNTSTGVPVEQNMPPPNNIIPSTVGDQVQSIQVSK